MPTPSDQDRWTAVDRYLADRLLEPDAALDAALEASATAGLPAHGVSPTQGRLLELLARIQGARTILELGTLGAYSTICFARALPPNGRLVTLEVDAGYAAEYLAAALELSRPGTLIVADNVIRGGAVLDGDDPSAVGVRGFFDVLAAEPRLRATAIQTVGEKGYDGFALVVVL